ncbi:MAG: zinc-binding dehydrogenase [Thermoleophilia bacterium]
MKGLTFQGVQDVRVEEVPDPGIDAPTDAIVRVTMAAICGSDLHIYNAGEAFGFPEGSRLGHEFIGTVEAVGADVRNVKPGDRVLSSCSVACGECTWCREGLASSCVRWSLFGWAPRTWQHGGSVQGGQSELVRVPLADATLHPMPEALAGDDRERSLLPIVDVMSTGWHGLISAGAAPGQSVVVIGDGAVGLAGVHGAKAKGAERIVCLGHHAGRLETATTLGATLTVDSRDDEEIKQLVMEHTSGEGAHVVVDTISGPESMATAHATVRPGGTIACLGMDHFMGKTPSVNWFDQFLRNISVTGGLVPGRRYFPELLGLVESGALDPAPMLSHTLSLGEAADGYRMMAQRADGVTKVALRPGG